VIALAVSVHQPLPSRILGRPDNGTQIVTTQESGARMERKPAKDFLYLIVWQKAHQSVVLNKLQGGNIWDKVRQSYWL